MISGDGADEKPSSAVASLYDPACDRESDGGEELSRYSSCGGDSEFERYCSASSAMGTPSFGSSSFRDSDFGSLKGFKLEGETSNLKSFAIERVLSSSYGSENGSGFCRGTEGNYYDRKEDGVLNLNGRMETSVAGDFGLKRNYDADGNRGNEVVNASESKANGDGSTRNTTEFQEIEEGEAKLSDEGEALSRDEHSEGEHSMFGCGSDDERKTDFYYEKNALHGEKSGKNGNPLAINSAIAFGSDDWDDFVQGSGDYAIGSMAWEWDQIQGERHTSIQSGNGSLSFVTANYLTYPSLILEEQEKEVRNAHADYDQVEACGKLAGTNADILSTNSVSLVKLDPQVEDAKGVLASVNQVGDMDELAEYLGSSSAHNVFQMNKDPPAGEALSNEELRIRETEPDFKCEGTVIRDAIAIHHDVVSRNMDLEKTKKESDPRFEYVVNHHYPCPGKSEEDKLVKVFEDNSSSALLSLAGTTTSPMANKKNTSYSFQQIEGNFLQGKKRDFELNDFYHEIVNDMEDILLDFGESPASGVTNDAMTYQSQFPQSARDGGSSASTSGTDYAYDGIQEPLRIDGVQVVGARQKKGDVSFSERLVGVQKYTVYKIRVWSGEETWEVERRYRDFSTLYYLLKKLFSDHGWTLPSPWSFVERESRKLFGNASPDVIADRSVLIQECLQSVIHPKFSSGSFKAVAHFLSPSKDTSVSQSPVPNRSENFSTLGKTISLVVQIRPSKSMKQMLDEQHYRCADCRRNFDDGKTKVQGFVQALGWGKPRLCEYSGHLFCSSCHNNDTAVLPARVLHFWDFTRYPVSHLAKSFLDSTNDQPMLCVSAVNPFLFAKVPTLQHVANIRNRIRAMLPYVRCPFRRSIYKGLGSRKYLLDSNDFFALRDLIDVSKGVFSALPVMVETVSRKIQEHITEQCLVCYDAGTPCNARQECNNPLSLIFPFQEGEVEKCRSCKSVFHKNCIKKASHCSCGAPFKPEDIKQSADERVRGVDSNLSLLGSTAESSTGLLTGLFSKVMPGRSHIPRKESPEGTNNVILMDSFPSTSL